jgi:superfamily II DNA/RNA helicase
MRLHPDGACHFWQPAGTLVRAGIRKSKQMHTEVSSNLAPQANTALNFDALKLHASLTRAVADAGYTQATEVQSRAIPAAMAGKDLMVSSSTGSGKTASFVLPALMRVLAAREQRNVEKNTEKHADKPTEGAPRRDASEGPGLRRDTRDFRPASGPRVLVLCPTRELAMQVAKATADYGRHIPNLRVATVVGGVPYGAQLKALRGPLDVLIATPGRLIDHMESGKALLANVELLVLDEADRMLDMGFIEPIQHIAGATPATRQTMMFSATFAGFVGRLAEQLLRNPQRIDISSHTEAHADIEQRLHWADDLEHKNALLDHILTERSMEQAVVFTSTQRDADWLADRLADMGHHVASLHGGHPQGRRTRVLQGLRSKHLKILVATDVASRGIDVPSISHVINYGLPMKEEDYVHRIGRTGRAGRTGLAVTLAERRDSGMIHRIQRYTTQRIPATMIEGLEPKRAEPKPAPRPFSGPGGPGGKPAFGARSFARPGAPGKNFKPAGKTFSKANDRQR